MSRPSPCSSGKPHTLRPLPESGHDTGLPRLGEPVLGPSQSQAPCPSSGLAPSGWSGASVPLHIALRFLARKIGLEYVALHFEPRLLGSHWIPIGKTRRIIRVALDTIRSGATWKGVRQAGDEESHGKHDHGDDREAREGTEGQGDSDGSRSGQDNRERLFQGQNLRISPTEIFTVGVVLYGVGLAMTLTFQSHLTYLTELSLCFSGLGLMVVAFALAGFRGD